MVLHIKDLKYPWLSFFEAQPLGGSMALANRVGLGNDEMSFWGYS